MKGQLRTSQCSCVNASISRRGAFRELYGVYADVDLNGVIQDGIVRELERTGTIAAVYAKYGL
jgi:hypothetical protein